MRRLLTFACQSEQLAASLDAADSDIGLLLVTGGSQTRVGSHRMYERLAKYLSDNGYPCFRFDRRGVGDSSGEDPGFLGSGPDLTAAAAAFRKELPQLRQMIGFGLCDGASTLALFGAEAGVDAVIMVNPWLVEAGADAPPPAAISAHYKRRLLSREGWRKLFKGEVSLLKLARGIRRLSGRAQDSPLAADVASALARGRVPAEVVLAEGDATAISAAAELNKRRFAGRIGAIQTLASDSHTFARPGDELALGKAVLAALPRLAV
jgi:exosortase A-associated hydrolase 1